MLSPHEFKNKEFTKSLRGYSTEEVDEHIDFITEKYTELYRANDALEKKLRLTEAQLDAMKSEEESIRSALVNAQKASSRIISEANERADVIMRSAKNSCDRLIAELKADVEKENERLIAIREETALFKAALFEAYQAHISQIEQIAPDIEPSTESGIADADKYADIVMSRIREDLNGKHSVISGSDDPFASDDANYTEKGKSVPAESIIPDDVTERAPEKDTSFASREGDEFDFSQDDGGDAEYTDGSEFIDENDFQTSRSSAAENSDGIIGSIKKINKKIEDGSDDDLLRMINAASDAEGMSATEEFRIVYDGKNKK